MAPAAYLGAIRRNIQCADQTALGRFTGAKKFYQYVGDGYMRGMGIAGLIFGIIYLVVTIDRNNGEKGKPSNDKLDAPASSLLVTRLNEEK